MKEKDEPCFHMHSLSSCLFTGEFSPLISTDISDQWMLILVILLKFLMVVVCVFVFVCVCMFVFLFWVCWSKIIYCPCFHLVIFLSFWWSLFIKIKYYFFSKILSFSFVFYYTHMHTQCMHTYTCVNFRKCCLGCC